MKAEFMQQLMELSEKQIIRFKREIVIGPPHVNVTEARNSLHVWTMIQQAIGTPFTEEQLAVLQDAIVSGEFGDLSELAKELGL